MAHSLRALLNHPQSVCCQKRTGHNKQFTVMNENYIYKGPYSSDRLNTIIFRTQLLKKWFSISESHSKSISCLVVFPLIDQNGSTATLQSDLGPFLLYDNLAKGYPIEFDNHQESFSDYKYRVLRRQILLKLNDVFTDYLEVIRIHAQSLLLTLCYFYILNVGDVGLSNMLIDCRVGKIYVIDFDENRGPHGDFSKSIGKETDFFWCNKDPNQTVRKHWLQIMPQYYSGIRNLLIDQKCMIIEDLQKSERSGRSPFIDRYFQLITILDILIKRQFNYGPNNVSNMDHTMKANQLQLEIDLTFEQIWQQIGNKLPSHIDLNSQGNSHDNIGNGDNRNGNNGNNNNNTNNNNGNSNNRNSNNRNGNNSSRGNMGLMIYKGPMAGSLTWSGKSIDVMKSVLQKGIRRRLINTALIAAIELYRMNEVGGRCIQSNMFNRLAVITVEDIGIANLHLVQFALGVLIKDERHLAQLTSLVKLLAQSQKTRLASHLWTVYTNGKASQVANQRGLVVDLICPSQLDTQFIQTATQLAINYLRQEHLVGKGSGIFMEGDPTECQPLAEMFYLRLCEKNPNALGWARIYLESSQSSKLKVKRRSGRTKPDIILWEMMKLRARQLSLSAKIINLIETLQEGYFTYSENRPFLVLGVMLFLYPLDQLEDPHLQANSVKELCIESISQYPQEDFKDADESIIYGLQSLMSGRYQLIVEDYMIDKHTKEGKQAGSNRQKFVIEGAKVIPQHPQYYNHLLAEIYQMDL